MGHEFRTEMPRVQFLSIPFQLSLSDMVFLGVVHFFCVVLRAIILEWSYQHTPSSSCCGWPSKEVKIRE